MASRRLLATLAFMKLALAVAVAVCWFLIADHGRAGPNLPPPSAIPADPDRPWLVPPVDGPIVQRFQAPGTDWGPGHRGIDFYAAPETAVRAAGSGRVAFAGAVAAVKAVTIQHSGDVKSSYTDLAEVHVEEGAYVLQGEWIGRTGVAHRSDAEPGLHFGVRVAGAYVNPEDFFGPVDYSRAIFLAPLIGGWARSIPGYGAGSHLDETCRPRVPIGSSPPNDNIAVVVAGLATQTVNGRRDPVFDLARSSGYPERRTYVFSYKGSDAPDLHEPYSRLDTYSGLRTAAGKLTAMLIEIAKRHPESDVDLLAHSQGGLVVRSVLEHRLSAWMPVLPQVDHVVTYSAPHKGTKLAELPADLRGGSFSGSVLTDAVSELSRNGAAIPDPNSQSVSDLAPDSSFIGELADHDVVLGTRVLSLATPNDWLVPTARSRWDEQRNDVVSVSGPSGHSAILESEAVHGVAGAFLRDSAPDCATTTDHLAPGASRVVDFAHDHAADLYGMAEDHLIGRGLRVLWKPRRR